MATNWLWESDILIIMAHFVNGHGGEMSGRGGGGGGESVKGAEQGPRTTFLTSHFHFDPML